MDLPQENQRPTTPEIPHQPAYLLSSNNSNLMSPPEPVMDSFSTMLNGPEVSNVRESGKDTAEESPTHDPMPMSPPISPYTCDDASGANPSSSTPPNHTINDPLLYPADGSSSVNLSESPLFVLGDSEEQKRILDCHNRVRDSINSKPFAHSMCLRYRLDLYFHSNISKHFLEDPKSWLHQEIVHLQDDRAALAQFRQEQQQIISAPPIVAPESRAPNNSARMLLTLDRVRRQSRRRSNNNNKNKNKNKNSNGNGNGNAGPSSASGVGGRRVVKSTSATPEASRRTSGPTREDTDFAALPDFCPPTSSLPNRANSLKVDWPGRAIDLTGDDNAHLLHPDEIVLASKLRLKCATYLTSKRRIFERRLHCLRIGKEFRKTDAQKACYIDVNKASQLWDAFEKVGWLDAHWVQDHV